MYELILWHSIYLVPVCSGFPEVNILLPSSGVQQSLWGKLGVWSLYDSFLRSSHGVLWKAVGMGNVLLSLNTETETLGAIRELSLRSNYLRPPATLEFRDFQAGDGWAMSCQLSPSTFGSHLKVTIHRTEWLRYSDFRQPKAFRFLPSFLLDAQAGLLAADSQTQVHLSFSLFVPCQISDIKYDPEPCHLE